MLQRKRNFDQEEGNTNNMQHDPKRRKFDHEYDAPAHQAPQSMLGESSSYIRIGGSNSIVCLPPFSQFLQEPSLDFVNAEQCTELTPYEPDEQDGPEGPVPDISTSERLELGVGMITQQTAMRHSQASGYRMPPRMVLNTTLDYTGPVRHGAQFELLRPRYADVTGFSTSLMLGDNRARQVPRPRTAQQQRSVLLRPTHRHEWPSCYQPTTLPEVVNPLQRYNFPLYASHDLDAMHGSVEDGTEESDTEPFSTMHRVPTLARGRSSQRAVALRGLVAEGKHTGLSADGTITQSVSAGRAIAHQEPHARNVSPSFDLPQAHSMLEIGPHSQYAFIGTPYSSTTIVDRAGDEASAAQGLVSLSHHGYENDLYDRGSAFSGIDMAGYDAASHMSCFHSAPNRDRYHIPQERPIELLRQPVDWEANQPDESYQLVTDTGEEQRSGRGYASTPRVIREERARGGCL
ncbi:hypothetical protein CERZMDRAFT_100218 [Cercospora zeae-maydis SCOH1-5]|uniref:Uncharacterized protein n=1 Tax=Cercospora zeae-maydis SCOH1-5 TaxID=717836 RepID=A0A6A6F6K4_9PEZI|nr:hypothetical protein CERZMDRAFT_100218 [Cercospora zeae-maydis SCOH1-5]